MNMYLIIAISPEHVHAVAELLGPDQELRREGLAIFVCDNYDLTILSNVLTSLEDQGIAYNFGTYNDSKCYRPTLCGDVRYDHDGSASINTGNINAIDSTRREIFHERMKGSLITRDIDRLAHVLFIRDEWDNQVKYGKLHKMLKLIGAV